MVSVGGVFEVVGGVGIGEVCQIGYGIDCCDGYGDLGIGQCGGVMVLESGYCGKDFGDGDGQLIQCYYW